MSFQRPLRGGCHCGRNRYIIQFPKDAAQLARVHFNSHPSQHISHTSSPLAAFLRVPLQWYYSTTHAVFPDETSSTIHKVYTSPSEAHAMRHFCSFCGTPLSYWSEQPRSEADYIHLTLGSLAPEDLADLEDLGFLPGSDDETESEAGTEGQNKKPTGDDDISVADDAGAAAEEELVMTLRNKNKNGGRETVGGLPWLDSLMEGSRLGRLRRATKGQRQSGPVKVEWEIVEWTEGDDDESQSPRNGKRKLAERGDSTSELPV
ncbi:hypothetical protein B0T17DRAFT_200642 [Bombardia bombarda]|uniref:CENP-V/GFA domain-containing protein n=1 Tax=Bombardia bombarda TaxID=252184 RepID=A0AA40C9T9_9PEZI|nr:hypothetical protein B0T17DRAFT_200642 [Bombardia bombarda]